MAWPLLINHLEIFSFTFIGCHINVETENNVNIICHLIFYKTLYIVTLNTCHTCHCNWFQPCLNRRGFISLMYKAIFSGCQRLNKYIFNHKTCLNCFQCVPISIIWEWSHFWEWCSPVHNELHTVNVGYWALWSIGLWTNLQCIILDTRGRDWVVNGNSMTTSGGQKIIHLM